MDAWEKYDMLLGLGIAPHEIEHLFWPAVRAKVKSIVASWRLPAGSYQQWCMPDPDNKFDVAVYRRVCKKLGCEPLDTRPLTR